MTASLTPNRDANDAAMDEARRLNADALAREDYEGIGIRMMLEATHAVNGGLADLLDRGMGRAGTWQLVSNALSGALTAYLMGVTEADPKKAQTLLPQALASIAELAVIRLSTGAKGFSYKQTVEQQEGSA